MTPDRPAMLAVVAAWPIPARQAWGERANHLAEVEGVAFPTDELIAFAEVRARLDAGEFRAETTRPDPAGRRPGPDIPNLFGGDR